MKDITTIVSNISREIRYFGERRDREECAGIETAVDLFILPLWRLARSLMGARKGTYLETNLPVAIAIGRRRNEEERRSRLRRWKWQGKRELYQLDQV